MKRSVTRGSLSGAALGELIRELIVQGAHEGLAAARARSERIGRPP
ncbi:hypothetical protein [Streptomyces sp. NPDC056821]